MASLQMNGTNIAAFSSFLLSVLNDARLPCVIDAGSDADDEICVEVEGPDGEVHGFTIVITNKYNQVD